mgnify:CR=1 FL=1
MTLRLTNLADDQIPIELAGLTPAGVTTLSLDEIRQLQVRRGNREAKLGDLFKIAGDPTDEAWLLAGDCRNVHGLGTNLASGSIVVDGSVGHRIVGRGRTVGDAGASDVEATPAEDEQTDEANHGGHHTSRLTEASADGPASPP